VQQLSCSVVRAVDAHSKGGMSVMVAHPNAPLLATGSASQVVKVWTDAGDVVSGRAGCWHVGVTPGARGDAAFSMRCVRPVSREPDHGPHHLHCTHRWAPSARRPPATGGPR
jgi:hypothetical protein